MEINFRTKEESNEAQRQEFLALSGGERFIRFIQNMERSKHLFPAQTREPNPKNFILDHTMRTKKSKSSS